MKNRINPDKWVENYGDYLFSLAKYKVNDDELAKDLIQETFFAGLRGKDSFLGKSHEKTWLVRILNNKIADHYRAGKKEIPMSEYLDQTDRSFNDSYFDLETPGQYGHARYEAFPAISGFQSDMPINQAELKRVLEICIEQLPPALSQVFYTKYILEENAESICKQFNISTSNYWVMLHRAKLLLRTCISKIW